MDDGGNIGTNGQKKTGQTEQSKCIEKSITKSEENVIKRKKNG